MKRLRKVRAACAVLSTAVLLGLALDATAQAGTVISARPGERPPRAVPEAGPEGVRLSLEEAVAPGDREQQDLTSRSHTAESSRYGPVSSMGIFDPLLEARSCVAHGAPATSALVGADVSTRASTNFSTRVNATRAHRWDFSLGFASTGGRNSSFLFP